MSDRHVVIGAGPVGRATATLLAERGSEVVLANRSGAGPEVPGARRVGVDASSASALGSLAEGAVALYNCVNPPAYHQWQQLWPPIAAAMLRAARTAGATLVVTGNLYPYGPVDGAMVEGMPDAGTGQKARIRARMWADLRAAHERGEVRAVEVRGSDYMGTGVGTNGHVPRLIPQALQGRSMRVFGDPDQPHTWTDVLDMARALIAVAGRDDTWGRVWHAPSNAPRSQRQAVNDVCAVMGRPSVRVGPMRPRLLRAVGLVVPSLGALQENVYQFTRPYVMSSELTQKELRLVPTPWDEVCRRTAMDAA
uniref:Nucleoside-diphosphate-sugar epimerases n=1 Tax=uncultured Nocardioidaceae bacterium TaxID=253824 RepID=A0A6J4MP92_9ACTN|nr:MAG: Nucleoside-diphosphate-sugar epimerases [uncultured Nocardioidaceae bacterium]